ncbi:hypothetical protein RO3G_04510 [Rhizopus delemar RA 99-880]|uniref:Cystinosin n=1 Tax=Rhizopus delemar (strain RA 99-880 / ATCC MYA-4621 / FGSC 9543 / NRRL 43880) TaxID=246409 RepID=I1BUC5_RHIO9|nr:hypothetical protein RO3G_04510 [Rhizopus delemar RA 99-880]|eukprot:EIE79805.1 hypothetical protein RO3G_04510 [Rhizopus delemar RA 99-880]
MLNQESRGIGPIVSSFIGWFLPTNNTKLEKKEIFNLSFYFNEAIREEYRRRNNSSENLVQLNDVVFSVHAFLISLFTLFQTYYYKRDHSQHLSKTARLIKYIPQAWINFKRQSTIGWSIHNILLDFTGGALSIVQLVFDAFLSGDRSGISGHFVWYSDHADDEEQQKLIQTREESIA